MTFSDKTPEGDKINRMFKSGRTPGGDIMSVRFRLLGVLALFISGFAGLIVATGPSVEAATVTAPWRTEQTVASPAIISSISCPTTNRCFAVGLYTGQNNIYPAIYETNNGGYTWTSIGSSITNLASGTVLNSISCVSSIFCEAVGYQPNVSKDIEVGAAVVWNGSTWSNQSVPADGQEIISVSCVSSIFCEAGSTGAILLWNGITWTNANQTSISSTETIDSVSCVSESFCEAVDNVSERDNVSFVWNGTIWQYQASMPSLAHATILNSISCVSSTFCEAVGYTETSQHIVAGVSFLLSGTTWTKQDIPPNTSYLFAVSCVSSTFCEAVGGNAFTLNANPGVALIWNGDSWTDQALPSSIDQVQAVACLSSAFCEAAGNNFPGIVFLTTVPPNPTIASLASDSLPLAGGGIITISGAMRGSNLVSESPGNSGWLKSVTFTHASVSGYTTAVARLQKEANQAHKKGI